jgi:meso-butanediol dehydrogenase/(S,S)-butanediol dehydrogenase/diacetyl reductase
VLTSRSEERSVELAKRLDAKVSLVTGDLRDPGTVERVVECALSEYGRLDALINNAALDHTGDLIDTDLDEVRGLFEVNFFAALLMLQAAARVMVARGAGSIVNVTSRLATIGVPSMALYGATKGALDSLTRGAAVELASSGVRVNSVAPGMTRTPLFEAWLKRQDNPRQVERTTEAQVPQGRLADPEDVAAAIAFLASDDAAHVTGASLPVDGGYTAA